MIKQASGCVGVMAASGQPLHPWISCLPLFLSIAEPPRSLNKLRAVSIRGTRLRPFNRSRCSLATARPTSRMVAGKARAGSRFEIADRR